MKIKLKEILLAKETFEYISNQPKPFTLTYRCNKIMGRLLKEINNIMGIRDEMLKKYGEEQPPLPDGRVSYIIPKEKIPDFNKEFNDFIETEIEIDVDLIPLECLEPLSVSDKQLQDILLFIKQEDKEIA